MSISNKIINMFVLVVCGIVIISFPFLIVGGLLFGSRIIELTLFKNIPTQVFVNNKLVYSGRNGCLKIHSGGANTHVTVYGGFLCYFQEAVYMDKNIVIKGVK